MDAPPFRRCLARGRSRTRGAAGGASLEGNTALEGGSSGTEPEPGRQSLRFAGGHPHDRGAEASSMGQERN